MVLVSNETNNGNQQENTGIPGNGDQKNNGAEAKTQDRVDQSSNLTSVQLPASQELHIDWPSQLESLKDQILRAMADAENTRRRAQRELEEMAKYAVSNFAQDLLPIADSLSRALESLKELGVSSSERGGPLKEGVEMTERAMLSVFKKYGVSRIQALGEKFDPNFHQALFSSESSQHEEGYVMCVVQTGYIIHERLLRPALVGVSKGCRHEQEPTSIGDRSKNVSEVSEEENKI